LSDKHAIIDASALEDCERRLKTLYINGKFTAQRTTGVQRVAGRLIEALDTTLCAEGRRDLRCVLLCPPTGSAPTLRYIETRRVGSAAMGLHLWEQAMLPIASRGGALLSLAGSAPALKTRQVCMFHDAAVFDHPEAYTRTFAAWYRFLFRRLSRTVRLVLTVSEFSRRRLMKHLGVAADRIGVVHSGAGHLSSIDADASVVPSLGLEGKRYFIAVGSANPIKNHAALVKAFCALQAEDDVRLVIVGGAHDAVFAAQSRRHADERVIHAGPLPDAQLKGLYREATALVFPSLYEGYGLPPMEAMSCGCPVIATSAGAVPEVCGDAALYVDPASVSEMATAMQRLLAEPALRERLRRDGTRRTGELTWPAAGRELLSHLDAARVCGGGR
jgi:glycosyltransferase involved in cell wall biosynthesis